MADLKNLVLERADKYIFEQETNSPQKLREFVSRKVIGPIANELERINRDLYKFDKDENKTETKLVNEIVTLQEDDDSFKILKEYKDGLLILLVVSFKEGKAYKLNRSSQTDEEFYTELIYEDLTESLAKAFK